MNSNSKSMQCYTHGASCLELYKDLPLDLKVLFFRRDSEVRQFQKCIHKLNATFAFTLI
jgi:hypothetical protein